MAGWADVAIVGVAPVSAIAGILVGKVWEGRQDLRTARRLAYIAWLQVARTIMELPDATTHGAFVRLPSDAARRRLNDLSTELSLVASKPVQDAANVFMARVHSGELAQELSGRYELGSNEWIERFDKALEEPRKAVIVAMRRDLGM